MSAPPPYSPIPTSPAATVSSVSNLMTMLMSGDREHRGLGTEGSSFELWPLPPGVNVEKVYQGRCSGRQLRRRGAYETTCIDWLAYIVAGAKLWLGESDADGTYLWNKLEKTMGS